ncbi:MAG: prepilin peptidase [Parcubacteria group bacterium]|nr:prepilin peptidase [Parcubacteria group bacterium]
MYLYSLMPFFYFIIFLIGLVMGSFINAFVYRLHSGDSLLDRSKCPECKHHLSFIDLWPVVSFLLLQGKCRYCRKKISAHYPLSELVMAILFVFFFYRFGVSSNTIVMLFFGFVLFLFALEDFLYLEVEIAFLVPMIFVAIALRFFVLHNSIGAILYGVFFGALFFFVQYLITSGKGIGIGDTYLGALLGAMFGWPHILIVIFIAYIFGGATGIILLSLKRKELKQMVPLAPFLSAGGLIYLFYGAEIVKWIERYYIFK